VAALRAATNAAEYRPDPAFILTQDWFLSELTGTSDSFCHDRSAF